MDKKKNIGISFNDDENQVLYFKISGNADIENENDINNEKDAKYLEKYITCAENTKIKVIIFEMNNNEFNDDNSEEAFFGNN